MTDSKIKPIPIDSIRIDGGTQIRAEIDQATVTEYAEAMKSGDVLPPVTVYHDGKSHWLADGFHRYHAARKNKSTKIRAEVHTGTQRDAILYAVGANKAHGLKRSNADKRNAVEHLLSDDEWSKWSDRKLAEAAGVSQPFVSKMRSDSGDNGYHPETRTGRDGKQHPASKPTRRTVLTASDTDGKPTGPGAEFPSRWTNLPNDIQQKVKSGGMSVGEANALYDSKYAPAIDPPGHEPFHGPPPIRVEARQPGEDEKSPKNGAEVWPRKVRQKAAKALGDLIRSIPRNSPEGQQAQPHLDALTVIVEERK